ncbi:uncharacterized protein LOC134664051 [Cydia fagiglandana]|uniref:uncharacterized protein LOC134664051 n=1 Tax=Cydia fagiglandana TaxID=1458189 RepID=UPI002FEE0199
MTILTKPNAFIQIKKDMTKCPVADETILVEEEKVETYTPKPAPCGGVSVGLMVILLSVVGIYSGMYLFRRCLQPQPRYQGFCSIPIDTKQLQESALIEPNYRMLPIRWSSSPDPDVQIFAPDDSAANDVANFLREELDIGDEVEKITVFDNGRQTSFIHDFGANFTGIVDTDRCFTMELDPQLVLAPEAFVLSIQQGGDFDVTRVRSTLRALLPALPRRILPELCRAKPVYRLQSSETTIRKRSVEPPADYVQFSGRHIHEIEIENLNELIQNEKEN